MNIFKRIVTFDSGISIIIISLALATILMDSFGIMLFIPLILNYFMSTSSENNINQYDTSFVAQISDKLIDHININPILFVLAIFIGKSLILICHGYLIAYIKSEIIRSKRKNLLGRLFQRDSHKLMERSTGDLTNIVTEQGYRSGLVVLFCFQLLSQILATFLYVLFGLYISFYIGVYISCCAFVFYLVYFPLNRNLKKFSDKFAATSTSYSSRVDEIFSHRNYLKITRRSEYLSKDAGNLASEIAKCDRNLYKIIAISSALKEPLIIAFLVTVLSIEWYLKNSASTDILISLALIYRGATAGFSAQNFYQKFVEHTPSFELLENLARPISAVSTIVSENDRLDGFSNLRIINGKKSVNGRLLFNNLNIEIAKGETLAIVGKSGAGKSTLLSVMAGIIKLDDGDIQVIQKNELTGNCIEEVRFGLVPQEPAIFEGTLLNNVAFDFSSGKELSEFDLQRLYAILSDLGLVSELQLKKDLHFSISENGRNLSGGQKQRLHFARELFLDSELILLDEPTSALDHESSELIKKLIEKCRGIKTFVIVTHDMKFASSCDAIVRIGI